jgi:ATP-dependent protease ClpP protease subunit
MHNIGVINSIANVIFLAGAKRYASPHTTFLFHGAASQLNGMISLPQLNEIKDSLQKDHDTITGIICDNTKITEDEIKKLFFEGETKNVQFALEKGIINKIEGAKIPQEAKFISININS